VPSAEWKWFGTAAHFICGQWCRFHLCTLVGQYVVSTVGQLWFDRDVRAIQAEARGITIEGKGDAWDYDYFNKIGYEPVGLNRLYETMVFLWSGNVCEENKCNCGTPTIIASGDLDFDGYNTGTEATAGHWRLCYKWANVDPPSDTPETEPAGSRLFTRLPKA